jgi:hypothetical protein
VFETGDFTNYGDGGWINWGFNGSYYRPNNGGYVVFYQFAAAPAAATIDQPKEEKLQKPLLAAMRLVSSAN